jgi:fructokinase
MTKAGGGWDVACLGELFVDLTPHSKVDGQMLYAPSPGGAPGNVAVGLARLGRKVLMLARVGDEAFGRLLVAALQGHGVDVSGVVLAASEKTGLSVVTLAYDGERSFMFYHDKPADQHMAVADVHDDVLRRCRVLHVGVLPLSGVVSAAAQRKAMEVAASAGLVVSCDVNFRPNLWEDAADMLDAGRFLLSCSTIVKVSEEELAALCPSLEMTAAVASLWHERLQLFSVTRGAQGAVMYGRERRFICEGFRVEARDTTGAGDAYTSAIINGAMDLDLVSATDVQLAALLRRACAAGALATTRKGAMDSQPTVQEIDALLAAQNVTVVVERCA